MSFRLEEHRQKAASLVNEIRSEATREGELASRLALDPNAILKPRVGIELARNTVDLLGHAMDEYVRAVHKVISEDEKLPSELKNAFKDISRELKHKKKLWTHIVEALCLGF